MFDYKIFAFDIPELLQLFSDRRRGPTESASEAKRSQVQNLSPGIDIPRWYCTLFCAMANLLFR